MGSLLMPRARVWASRPLPRVGSSPGDRSDGHGPGHLSAAPANITIPIRHLGSLGCTLHSPRVGGEGQLGGGVGRGQQTPSCMGRLATAGCWTLSSGPTGLGHQPGSQGAPEVLSAPALAGPHFPEAAESEQPSFPCSSTENMTSLQLPRGGSVSCSG